jgi:lysyl-tRNA synthetase class II
MRQSGDQVTSYDPQNLATVSGVVTRVSRSKRRLKPIFLRVKTDKGDVQVYVGPAAFLEQQKLTFAVGDKVEVTGSWIQHPQGALLMAGEVRKKGQVVKIMDANGTPLWSQRGPRKQ